MANIVGMSLDYLVKNIYDLIYPVGICIDFDIENADPNVLFQGTTWTRIVDGRYYVAGGIGTAGTLGGSNSFDISVSNLPTHSHGMSHTHGINHSHGQVTSQSAGAHTHTLNVQTGSFDYGDKTTNSSGAHTHTVSEYPKMESKNAPANGGYRMGIGVFDKVTSSSGAHTHTVAIGSHNHSVSGTTSSGGAHTHITNIPAYEGYSSGSSASNTENAGDGKSITFQPAWHKFARWKRTK